MRASTLAVALCAVGAQAFVGTPVAQPACAATRGHSQPVSTACACEQPVMCVCVLVVPQRRAPLSFFQWSWGTLSSLSKRWLASDVSPRWWVVVTQVSVVSWTWGVVALRDGRKCTGPHAPRGECIPGSSPSPVDYRVVRSRLVCVSIPGKCVESIFRSLLCQRAAQIFFYDGCLLSGSWTSARSPTAVCKHDNRRLLSKCLGNKSPRPRLFPRD